MKAKLKIWIENEAGQSFLGDGRAELLEAIRETGTLSAAAKRMKMSYRKAWYHLNEMEKVLDQKLVDRSTGGKAGGGCELTEAGLTLLGKFFPISKRTRKIQRQNF